MSLGDAIGWASNALSTPGDYTRGALAGRLGERVSGRSLSDQWGLTDKNDHGWGSSLAGMGVDMATDPISYIPAGLLGKAFASSRYGKAAGAAVGRFHGDELGALGKIKPADYLSMMKDEGNPIGRLHALGQSAGVPVYPAAANEIGARSLEHLGPREFTQSVKGRLQPLGGSTGDVLAAWNPMMGQVIPNVADHPGIWSDLKKMTDFSERQYAIHHLSTPSPQHLAAHEIGHGLHLGGGQPRLNDWDLLIDQLRNNGDLRSFKPLANISADLSHYGTTNPKEFVAEAFARAAHRAAHGKGSPWAPLGDDVGHLNSLYHALTGPMVPDIMSRKLSSYL